MTAPLYGGVILERFRHPRYFGELPGADRVHEDVNPLCGDRLRIELRLGGDRSVETVRFQGDACAIATASADLLAEMVEGRSMSDAVRIERDTLLTALGAPIRSSRLGCVALPLAVLHGALGATAEQVTRVRGPHAVPTSAGPPGHPGE